MAKLSANGVELEYQVWGEDNSQPLLIVAGLGVQLNQGTVELTKALVERGFKVIAFDNRDVGLSTKLDSWGPADIKTAFTQARAKQTVEAPYNLSDMAKDAAALLDALDIPRAHIVGGSNGGAVAQIMAIEYPEKVATLISIMATSGRRGLPRPHGEAAEWLTRPRNPSGTRQGAMDEAVETTRIIGSATYPKSDAEIRDYAGQLYDRSFYPEGNGRHLLASLASADSRVEHLGEIVAPTLVIHGREDPLVPLGCAEDVKNSIPDAEMIVIDGMAHDYPTELMPLMADAIQKKAAQQPA